MIDDGPRYRGAGTAHAGGAGLSCALALSGALLAAALVQPVWDTSGGDDGMYVMLAWSLRHGLGYVHEVGSRAIPHTVWPPGLPAMLAGVLLARPESTVVSAQALQMLKLVPVLAYAYSILLAWVWVRSIGGSALAAIGVAALFLLHPAAIVFSQLLRAELPYTALSLGALIAAERHLLPDKCGTGYRNNRVWRHSLILLLALAAAYTRPIGVTLLGAVLLRLLLAGRLRLMLVSGALGGLALLPWLVWVTRFSMDDQEAMRVLARSHFSWLLQRETGTFDIMQRSLGELPLWALQGLWLYAGYGTPHLLVQSRLPLEPVAGLAVTALLIAGGIACWRQGAKVSCLYVLLYLGILLVWEERTNRLLVPLLPVLLYCAYQGLDSALRRLPAMAAVGLARLPVPRHGGMLSKAARTSPVLAAVVFLLLGANYVRVGTLMLTRVHACGEAADCLYPPAWQGFLAAGEWLRLHTTGEDIVLTTEPVKLRLASGVPAVPYVLFGSDGADDLAQAIARWRVTYIVEDTGLYSDARARLASSELQRNVLKLPGVEKVWEDQATGTRVWRAAN